MKSRLLQAIDCLSIQERTVIALFYREGLSHGEIGEAMAVSAIEAEELRMHALTRLRQQVGLSKTPRSEYMDVC